MALRAALVSVVASLGLTFPSAGDLDRWARAAQDWMCTQVADWDARVSLEDPLATASNGIPTLRTAKVGESGVTEPAPELGVEELVLAFAGEIAQAEDQQSQDVTKQAPRPETAVLDSAFSAVVEEMASRFAVDSLKSSDEPAHGSLVATERSRGNDGLKDEPLEVEGAAEMGVQFALALNREAEGLSDSPPLLPRVRPATSEVVRCTPSFEPLEAAGATEPGVVIGLALNREAEGFNTAPEVTASRPQTDINLVPDSMMVPVILTQERQLADAVRLTREAVFAWIKLLHSPAVVTIPR
jgi:hypothetical protein